MKGWLETKAALSKRDFTELLEEEGMSTLMQGDTACKVEPGLGSCEGVGLGQPRQSSSWTKQKKQEINDLQRLTELELQGVKLDIQTLIKEKKALGSKVESKTSMIKNMKGTCESFEFQMKNCDVEEELWKLKKTLDFYIETAARLESEYTGLLEEKFLKEAAHVKLEPREAFLQDQVAELEKQVFSLRSGRLALAMHRHPMCNSFGTIDLPCDFVKITTCVLCDSKFSYGDIVVCSCRHVYHPWCAFSWFSKSVKCVEKSCFEVHPDWWKSFGLGELLTRLEEKAQELDCEGARNVVLSARTAAAKRT
ncbi:hypothetical protein M758_UG138600 [Ceratodon purpureus]|nr:hypothetical protein M758_UG138600 [Ceratodon purpureus]